MWAWLQSRAVIYVFSIWAPLGRCASLYPPEQGSRPLPLRLTAGATGQCTINLGWLDKDWLARKGSLGGLVAATVTIWEMNGGTPVDLYGVGSLVGGTASILPPVSWDHLVVYLYILCRLLLMSCSDVWGEPGPV